MLRGNLNKVKKTLCVCWLSKGRVSNMSGTAEGIQLIRLGKVKGDIEKGY